MLPETKFVRLGAPIVLAHGLFGFTRIGVGRLTITSYFRGHPRGAETAGQPGAGDPRAGDRRGRGPGQALGDQILRAFPDEPVHVIGHSMGGLDARRLLADPSWQRRVLSLTTIGTPHLGTALADFAKLRVGRVFRLLAALGIDPQGLPRRDPPRRAPVSPPASRSREPPLFLRGGRPRDRNGVLAPPTHSCRTLGAGRAQRRPGAGRLRAGFGTPLPRGPSITSGR